MSIFNALPEVPKQIIINCLLSQTGGVEIQSKSLPITWLFSAPDEELDPRREQEYTDPERALWVDTWVIERTEVEYRQFTHLSTYAGILLASHWGLVDVVYLKPIAFQRQGGLWRGPRSNIPFISKLDFEEFRQYLGLCAHIPVEFDPFMIKELRDVTCRLKTSED